MQEPSPNLRIPIHLAALDKSPVFCHKTAMARPKVCLPVCLPSPNRSLCTMSAPMPVQRHMPTCARATKCTPCFQRCDPSEKTSAYRTSCRISNIGQPPSRAAWTAPKRIHKPIYVHTPAMKRANSCHAMTSAKFIILCQALFELSGEAALGARNVPPTPNSCPQMPRPIVIKEPRMRAPDSGRCYGYISES